MGTPAGSEHVRKISVWLNWGGVRGKVWAAGRGRNIGASRERVDYFYREWGGNGGGGVMLGLEEGE